MLTVFIFWFKLWLWCNARFRMIAFLVYASYLVLSQIFCFQERLVYYLYYARREQIYDGEINRFQNLNRKYFLFVFPVSRLQINFNTFELYTQYIKTV